MKSNKELLENLEKLANEDCACSDDQQTGKDGTICKTCEAARVLNEVGEILRLGTDIDLLD